MNDEISNLVSWITTIIVSIVGWGLALIQFSKQHKKNIVLEERRLKKELQIKAADEALVLLGTFRESLHPFITSLTGSPSDLRNFYLAGLKLGERWEQPDIQLLKLWKVSTESSTKLIYFFEAREVILHKFNKTQESFKSKFIDTSDQIFSFIGDIREIYFLKVLKNIPIDDSEIEELEKKCYLVLELIIELQSYIYDYTVELQNAFLSETFNYRVTRRQPLDLTKEVLKIND